MNSDISHGGIELEMWSCAAVLAQYVRCKVIAIIEGQQVILTNMETGTDNRKVVTVAFLPNEYTECPISVVMWPVYCVFCSEPQKT